MVVGAPHVDEPVVAALALLLVVGDVRREVGVVARRALEHAVLVVAEVRRAQPQRALAAIDAPLLLEHVEGVVHGIGLALMQRTLRRPEVECHPEALERLADVGEHLGDAALRELVEVHVPRLGDLLCELGDVRAAVAVLGDLLAARPRPDGLGELAHLRAVVVGVELARDLVALKGEQPRERVAVRRVARVADVHGPGRVRGDELDIDALAHRRAAPAPAVAGVQDRAQRAAEPLVAQPQVQEPGPGDLDALQPVAEPPAQLVGERGGDLPRCALQHRREQHRRVGRVVAEVGLLRSLEARGAARAAVAERRGGVLDGGAQFFQGPGHG